MFGAPGPLRAKLGNFELGGWGAHVCYSLPSLGPPPETSMRAFSLFSKIQSATFFESPAQRWEPKPAPRKPCPQRAPVKVPEANRRPDSLRGSRLGKL